MIGVSRSWQVPALLFALCAAVIAGAWAWLGAPVAMPAAAAGGKLPCVSYAPFRADQSPLDPATRISPEQIDQDFARLSRVTGCVRSYSLEFGLERIPEIARRHGLTVLLGLWLSSNAQKNRSEIDGAVALANRHPDVVRAVIVGNEVLLRGEMAAGDVAAAMREVKSRVPAAMPVTYADVWEFWLRNAQLRDAADFVTVHILPYWEDFPISAREAASHVGAIRRKVGEAFAGKDILIGEVGWPSEGRVREGALPSPVNQAQVVHEVVALAARENWRVNLIEAFDQPWKRALEGTVGGHWGLFDVETRAPKFVWGEPVSNHPAWRMQAAQGIALAAIVFLAAWHASRRPQGQPAQAARWLGVATCAVAAGCLVPFAIARVPIESLGAGGWARSLAFVLTACLAPVVGSALLMRGLDIPAFHRVLRARNAAGGDTLSRATSLILVALTLLAIQAALGLAFDPRYRDFPFAPLTAAAAPFAVLGLSTRRLHGRRNAAEIASAGILLLSAGYVALNESFENWQAIWFCAALAVLALSLLRVRDARS